MISFLCSLLVVAAKARQLITTGTSLVFFFASKQNLEKIFKSAENLLLRLKGHKIS